MTDPKTRALIEEIILWGTLLGWRDSHEAEEDLKYFLDTYLPLLREARAASDVNGDN